MNRRRLAPSSAYTALLRSNVTFSGATVTVQGNYNATGSNTFSSGTANFTGTVASAGTDLRAKDDTAELTTTAGLAFPPLPLTRDTHAHRQTARSHTPGPPA